MAVSKGSGQLTLMDMNDIVASATQPSNPSEGALWYNTTEGQLYVHSSGQWIVSNNVIVGGRNYYKQKTVIYPILDSPTITKNPPTAPNGFRITGQQNLLGSVRVSNVINENGWWTVSFWGMANTSSTLKVDISDLTSKDFDFTTSWKKFTLSAKVTNYSADTYNFVDINNIGFVNYDIKDFKVEKGNIPTDWSPAPEDIDEVITDITETLGNMANDNLIEYNERKVIKDKLTDIMGYVIPDATTTLPTTATLDAGTSGRGSFYFARKSATMAGLSTTISEYTALATAWDNASTGLKTYLDGLPTVKPWDVSSANSKKVSAVTKATFRDRWKAYYTAELALANKTAEQLKRNVDDVVVGGTNYASNGDFEYDISKSLWSNSYNGQIKEVVDISTETPPFRKALHIKNTANGMGGILGTSSTIWSGVSAQSMANKEITITYWLKYSGIVVGANSWQSGRFGELVIEGQRADGTKVYRYPRIHSDGTPTESLYTTGTNTTWVKYSATHKLSMPSGAVKLTAIQFKHGLEQCVGEFWTTGIQIEIGNRASDWSESPYDVKDRITNVEMSVTGESIINKIKTEPAWGEKANLNDIAKLNSNQLLHKTRFTDNPASKWIFTPPWIVDNTKFFEGFGTAKVNQSGLLSDSWLGLYSEFVEATAGEFFTGSAYMFTDSFSVDAEDRKYYMEIEFYSSTNTRISALGMVIKNTAINTWERFSNTVIAPTNTAKVRMRFQPTRNGRFWISKPMLSRSAVLTSYAEHVDELATELSSQISQTSDKVAIVVGSDNKIKGESIASSIVATPNAIELMSENIDLTGKVTFTSLNPSMSASFETNGKVKAGNLSGTVPNANIASSGLWESARTSVNDMLSDLKITPLEKSTLKNESEKIKKEYSQKIIQADIVGVDATAYKNAYNAIYNTSPKMDIEVLSSMTSTYTLTTTTRDSFKAQLIEYYNQVAILSKLITDNTADLGMAMTGKMLYDDPLFRDGMNGIFLYNNSGGTHLSLIRQNSAIDSPSGSSGMIEIKVTGATTTPYMGGFSFQTPTKANAIFYVRFVAKVPTNYSLGFATNAIGTNGNSTKWLTSNLGTGKWEEYIYKINCGSVAPFSSTAFFYMIPPSGVTPTYPISWFLDSATVYEHNSVDYTTKDSAKMISDMTSDGKLSPTEKIQLRKEWGLIIAEYITTKTIAQNYSVSTGNYDSAYNTLNSQIPNLISDMLTTSSTPSNLRTNFENYYKRRAELSSDVTDKTFSMQSSVGTISSNPLLDEWSGSIPTGTSSWGDSPTYIKKETTLVRDGKASVRFNGMGTGQTGLNLNNGFFKSGLSNPKYLTVELSFYLVSGSPQSAGILIDWVGMSSNNRASINLSDVTNETIVTGRWYNVKFVAKRPHDNVSGFTGITGYLMANYSSLATTIAKDIVFNRLVFRDSSIEEIKSYEGDIVITDMASDSKITPQEKIQLKKEWSSIQREKPKMISTTSNAGMLSSDAVVADYNNDYNALSSQITPVLANMLVTSTVTSAFRTAFDNYYDAKATLLDAYNQRSYQAKKLIDTWVAPNQTKIDGSMIEASSIISARILSIANGSSTEIVGGQIVSDGNFQRLFEGDSTDQKVTYISRFESNNGVIKMSVNSKKTADGVERVPVGAGRTLYYTDKNVTTQRDIHYLSPNKNGARFIDFFADETATSGVSGVSNGGLAMYSGQWMYLNSEDSMQLDTGRDLILHSYNSTSVRSAISQFRVQPRYDSNQANTFIFDIFQGASYYEMDGLIRYGSIESNAYGSGIRLSRSTTENTVYITDGTMAKNTGDLSAKKIMGKVIEENGKRVVTDDRMVSGKAFIQPVANEPTMRAINFGKSFSSTPTVIITANTEATGTTVKMVSVSDITNTGFRAWVHRTTTTNTQIEWIAMNI